MGGFYETDRMIEHRHGCDICKAATSISTEYGECCDTYGDMFELVMDYECNEGPWEDLDDCCLMCGKCDMPCQLYKVCAHCGFDNSVYKERA
jgi:hypothetical protein